MKVDHHLIIALNAVVLTVGAFLSYLGLAGEVVGILLVLMIVDVLTGVIKSRCTGKVFTSRRLVSGIYSKFAGAAIVIMAAFTVKLASLALGGDIPIPFILGTIVFMAAVGEFYSIARNLIAIGWKIEIEEWNVWAFMVREIRDKAERIFKK